MVTPASAPAVRAAHLKEDLAALRALGPQAAAAVRARLSPASLAAIDEALRTTFLPLALNLEMAEAVFAEAGEQGARAWGTESLIASLDGFFKPLFLGITRFVSPSPSALYRVLPHGWGATYRNGGELRVERPAEDRARIVGLGLPEAMHTRAFLTAVCGTLGAAFRISSFTGEVVLEPFRPGGEVVWVVTWRAA